MNKEAGELSADCVDLIKHIVEKHNKSILEEFHSQLKAKNMEIERIKSVLEKLIVWQVREIGADTVQQLLEELHIELEDINIEK